MKFVRLAFYLLVTAMSVSCFNAPEYNEVPEIEIVEIRSTKAVPSAGDSVVVVLAFKDGDGDLGKANSADTTPNLFITDHRFSLIDSQSYSIPNIPQKGSVPDISGTIEINLIAKMYCNPLKPGASQDTLKFDFQVRDRSGNFSNIATSSAVILNCN